MQADDTVGAAAALGDLAVVVVHGDLVAEELRRLSAGVRDQGFLLRQFQLEVVTQERREAALDLFGFGLGSGEPEEGVVGVPGVMQPAEARIAGISAGHAA
ncbi:hypothetical protein [Dactylosporangium sp. NPDC050588]|uniref:hypothetical protein n=1 Tax=Dactylosporangium sp. NPDC050588 TaxID=3157211 RepID=UPI0033C47B22